MLLIHLDIPWISVEDAIPESGPQIRLILLEGSGFYYQAIRYDSDWYVIMPGSPRSEKIKNRVTYWTPMPKTLPPQPY